MGYDIQLYDDIEKDPMARGIARWHSKNGVTHLAPHDLMKLSSVLNATYTDVIATPECAPWSGASHAPNGFKGKRARLFRKARLQTTCGTSASATLGSTYCLKTP